MFITSRSFANIPCKLSECIWAQRAAPQLQLELMEFRTLSGSTIIKLDEEELNEMVVSENAREN